MATEQLTIVVNERGARVVKGKLADIGKGAKQAEGGVQLLRRALGFIGAAAIVRGMIKTADAFTQMQNRIRLVTSGTKELNETTDKLLALSQRTRSDMGANVELFNRITLATKDLGTQQSEVLQFTESLNQAIKISGASAVEASAGVIQLSQGLASGTLRGDELRSVLEQLPAVADVISKDLGITRGELRKFGQEGKINAEVVLKAFRNAREELEERFKTTVGTTAEEIVKLKNVVTVAFGRFNEAAGGTKLLAKFLNSLTQGVERAIPLFQSFGRALSGTLTPQDEMTAGMQLFASAVVIVQSALVQLVNILSNTVGTAFSVAGETIGASAAATVQFFKGNTEEAMAILDDLDARNLERIVASATELRTELVDETSQTIEALVNIWSEGSRLTAEARQMIFEGEGGEGGTIAKTKIDPAMQKLIDDLKELNTELLLQEQAMLQSLATGEEYAVILERMQTNAIAAATGQEGLAFDINETRLAIAALNLEAANDAFLQSQIETNAAMQVAVTTGRELNDVLEDMAIARQFAGDADGLARALDLADARRKLQTQRDEAETDISAFLKRARENAQDILGDALANAFTGGFDELPAKFAQVLLELSSQLLASEIFKMLGNIGGGAQAGSGTGGIIASAVGAFFGGNFAQGGQFQVPSNGGGGGSDSVPTLMNLTPRETVTITPPNQSAGGAQSAPPAVNVEGPTIINTFEDADIVAAFNRGGGGDTILNIVSENAGSFRQALGVQK